MTAILGDLVTIVSGFPFASELFNDQKGIPIARIRDVVRGRSETFYDGPFEDTYVLSNGDLLVGMDGEFNSAIWQGGKAVLNQRVCKLIPDTSKLNFGYLKHILPKKLKEIEARTPFVTVKHLSLKEIRAIQVVLPPLEEQKRIAAILDKADSLRRKRQQAIRLADEFLRAVFLDMFGDPVTNPKGWQVVKLGELAKSDRYAIKAGPFGSALKKECYVSSGYRIYGQEQVIRDDLTFGDYYINEDKYRELESSKVESGDMLISLVGTFGKICIVPPEFEPGIINPRLMKVSFDPLKATPRFMKALLTSDSMVRKIESLSHGGTMGIVNVGIMKDLDIAVPPVAIQIRFEEVQQKLTTIKANYDAAEEQTTSAFSSLQSRFFS